MVALDSGRRGPSRRSRIEYKSLVSFCLTFCRSVCHSSPAIAALSLAQPSHIRPCHEARRTIALSIQPLAATVSASQLAHACPLAAGCAPHDSYSPHFRRSASASVRVDVAGTHTNFDLHTCGSNLFCLPVFLSRLSRFRDSFLRLSFLCSSRATLTPSACTSSSRCPF